MLTHSQEETRAYGARLAGCLQPGDVLALEGDLGAGKSELTRGIARGLGIDGPIPSPTFTILCVYDQGRIPLYHFDFYRVQSPEEIYEMGMDEYLGGDGIAVVEWPWVVEEVIPARRLRVIIRALDENTRDIELVPEGGFTLSEEFREGGEA